MRSRTKSRARTLLDGREILTGSYYQKRRLEVLRRDNFHCVRCGSSAGVQVHHRGKRSLLRDDRAENLETLCGYCHEKQHRPWTRRPVPPHTERRLLAHEQDCSPMLVACPNCKAAFGRWCSEVRP